MGPSVELANGSSLSEEDSFHPRRYRNEILSYNCRNFKLNLYSAIAGTSCPWLIDARRRTLVPLWVRRLSANPEIMFQSKEINDRHHGSGVYFLNCNFQAVQL
jgi:hypothetical protein